jgi:cytochrome c biogenesis protein CcmG, thiol:disulfide interchange protein DsbE
MFKCWSLRVPSFLTTLTLMSLVFLAVSMMRTSDIVKEAPLSVVQLLDGTNHNLTMTGENTVIVFWATWCPPCKVELARLNRLVESNPAIAKRIIAISVGEPVDVVRKAVAERGYKFAVATDETGEVAEKYKISGTPTILMKDKLNAIVWSTSGLSPTLEFRVKSHLSPDKI